MTSLCFPWEHWLLSADDTIPQQGIVWLLTAKPDIYLLSAMQVYGNVYVSEGQCLGEQAGSIKSLLENRPGHVEEAASPVENEEQLFAVCGACLGDRGDLTSEGWDLTFSRGREVQPQHCDWWSIESSSCPHASCSLSLFRLSLDTYMREFGMSLLLTWQPLQFSASHSGLSYPVSLRVLPCWDDHRSPGMCRISS